MTSVFSKATFIILLLLTMTFSASINYSEQSCANNRTLQTTYYTNNGTTNTTTAIDNTNCEYGCDTTSDTCKNLVTDSQYGYQLLFALAVLIFSLIYISNSLHTSQEIIKIMFVMIALLLMAGIIWAVGIIGSYYDNALVNAFSQLSVTIGYVIGMVFFFLFIKLIFYDFIPAVIRAVGVKKDA